MENINISLLEKYLDSQKIKHSINVANTAKKLALKYGENAQNAYIAGLLHDIARQIDSLKLLEIAKKNNLLEHEIEEEMPIVLHANVGAYFIQSKFEINKKDILEAVKKHTVAAPYMSNLDKILYLADIIEPERNFKGIDNLRKLAEIDLDKAFLEALNSSLAYIVEKGFLIHPYTVEARNNLIKNRE